MTNTKAITSYAAASLLLIAGSGWLLSLAFPGSAAHRALTISAVVAFVVQMLAFTLARRVRPEHVMTGWGLGALACFVTLVVMGFVSRPLGLPIEASLFGLATFLFLTELVEPLLLNR